MDEMELVEFIVASLTAMNFHAWLNDTEVFMRGEGL